jgi:hypothetical protein
MAASMQPRQPPDPDLFADGAETRLLGMEIALNTGTVKTGFQRTVSKHSWALAQNLIFWSSAQNLEVWLKTCVIRIPIARIRSRTEICRSHL